jgi:hypothetical protein
MQTGTFQCGHCGKLIAVAGESLGQRVRCPHCLGIVLAQSQLSGVDNSLIGSEVPVAAVAGADDSASTPLAQTTQQSRAEANPSTQQAETAAVGSAVVADGSVVPGVESSMVPEGTPQPVTAPSPLSFGQPEVAGSSAAWPAANSAHESLPDAHLREANQEPRPRLASPPQRTGVSIWLVIPLVSYSILATVLLFMFWTRLHAVEDHPLAAFLPDSEGDAPGVIRKPKGVNEARKRKLINDPLPDSLIVHLGETRNIGALAVTPRRVTREHVGVGDDISPPERVNGVSLVLFLELKNISVDQSFQPLDRYFDRKWREGTSAGPPPLTLLEAGAGERFFGGPAQWVPRSLPGRRNNSAAAEFIYLMGSDKPVVDPIDRNLDPGVSTEVFVCTDGSDPRSRTLLTRKGDFLWRVHLRRGLVRVKDRDVPAAAVIGVRFNGRDIKDG